MRVGIVGAGALGSVLGGLLSEGGVDTVLIERDKEQVRVVRETGLWLEGVSGERLIRPQIVWDPTEAGKVDLALVLVKSYDTRAAIPTIEAILSDDGVVLRSKTVSGTMRLWNRPSRGVFCSGPPP